MMERIFLSAPDVRGPEVPRILEAIESNWIAPAGPHLTEFENTCARLSGREFGVGLSSATAALQLALHAHGIGAGEEVITSTFTFVATANAIHHAGARPVFLDSEFASWNMCPNLLEDFLIERARKNQLPRAIMPVDLYGQPCNYAAIEKLAERFGMILIEDAAEALGASYAGRPAGSFGVAAAMSFNGNKTISTSGGGMLVTDDEQLAHRVRHLATQARDEAPHYQHTERGFNFRLSNLLAAFGLGQLEDLDARVARRRDINQRYRTALGNQPGVSFMPEGPDSHCTFWLTCIRIDPTESGFTSEELRVHLEQSNIESRPLWKPMHRQPAYADCESSLNGVSDSLFSGGLCLPSGSGMDDTDLQRIIDTISELY